MPTENDETSNQPGYPSDYTHWMRFSRAARLIKLNIERALEVVNNRAFRDLSRVN